jgi:hypothetical protein
MSWAYNPMLAVEVDRGDAHRPLRPWSETPGG